MKPSHSLLLAAALLTVTGAILFSAFHSKKSMEASTPAPASTIGSRAAETTVTTVPPASIRRAEASSNKTANAPAIPSGISSEKWQQATALTGMIDTFAGSDTASMGHAINTAEAENLLKALGLSLGSAASVSDLIAKRNDATKQASSDLMKQMTRDSRSFTEMVALSMMAQENPLTAEQQSRLDQLGHDQEEAVKAAGSNLAAWFEDDAFLTSVRGKLGPDEAARLDDYAAEQKRMTGEKTAFDNSQALAQKLGLDGDQCQQVFEAYRQNPQAGDEQILPILNETQKAAYQANKLPKSSVSISIQADNK